MECEDIKTIAEKRRLKKIVVTSVELVIDGDRVEVLSYVEIMRLSRIVWFSGVLV